MILIIDDDSAVRSSLSFMLKRAGYEAQTVSGPREAMEVVRSPPQRPCTSFAKTRLSTPVDW